MRRNKSGKKAITQKLVSDYHAKLDEVNVLEKQISDRIDYVLKTWFNLAGVKFKFWYFDDSYDESEPLSKTKNVYKHIKNGNIVGIFAEDIEIYDTEGEESLMFVDKFGKNKSGAVQFHLGGYMMMILSQKSLKE